MGILRRVHDEHAGLIPRALSHIFGAQLWRSCCCGCAAVAWGGAERRRQGTLRLTPRSCGRRACRSSKSTWSSCRHARASVLGGCVLRQLAAQDLFSPTFRDPVHAAVDSTGGAGGTSGRWDRESRVPDDNLPLREDPSKFAACTMLRTAHGLSSARLQRVLRGGAPRVCREDVWRGVCAFVGSLFLRVRSRRQWNC